MNLIIVESPTKAKTITKFLSADYRVESSFGHVRDLPKSDMGIDIENNFHPHYIVPAKAKKTIANLKALVAKADKIILASDEDREGEAIAWHLAEALKLNKAKIERIVFHEITKDAILNALKSPHDINMAMVDAQQARRILDRLVGYELSPFLWKKVAKGLSAGRVQSVAVRLIVEREKEIKKFIKEEYWTVEGEFGKLIINNEKLIIKKKTNLDSGADKDSFIAKLHRIDGKIIDKLYVKNKDEADKILAGLEGASYVISNLEKKAGKKNPPPPFTTSTLQQTANRFLGFSAKQTMTLAQRLYEAGFITYMRTDSFNLSDKFLSEAQNYLEKTLGKNYALTNYRRFKTKSKGAQEAHEAIRPTEVSRDPESLQASLDGGQYRLYKLIWQRALATQMPEAITENTTLDVDALKTPYQFHATGQILTFPGYLKIYPEKNKEVNLPPLEKDEKLNLIKLDGLEHFTEPPARYSDAGLIKVMESYGIGRPSTYAPTINTIIDRNYVNRDDNKRLAPTDIAFVVIDLLVAHFPHIVDYKFTAEMEGNLDNIALGKTEWQPVIKNFYVPFHENLENKYKEINKSDISPEETSTEICDKCGAPMIIKTGRYGKFLACSAFPGCKNIKSMDKAGGVDSKKEEQIKELSEKFKGEKCDKCEGDMIVKVGRFGPFLSCANYPKCKNIKSILSDQQKTGITCPICDKGEIVAKRSRRGVFYACSNYPACKNAYSTKPTGEKCSLCQSLIIEAKDGKTKCSNKECGK
jgi:DNA topoisomerase-1